MFVIAALADDDTAAIDVSLPPGDVVPVAEIRRTYLRQTQPSTLPVTLRVLEEASTGTDGQVDYVLEVTDVGSGQVLATVSILVVEMDGRFFVGAVGTAPSRKSLAVPRSNSQTIERLPRNHSNPVVEARVVDLPLSDADASARLESIGWPLDTDEEVVQMTAVYVSDVYGVVSCRSGRITAISRSSVSTELGDVQAVEVEVEFTTFEGTVAGSLGFNADNGGLLSLGGLGYLDDPGD